MSVSYANIAAGVAPQLGADSGMAPQTVSGDASAFKTGAETGAGTGVETKIETGVEAGAETGAEAGAETGAKLSALPAQPPLAPAPLPSKSAWKVRETSNGGLLADQLAADLQQHQTLDKTPAGSRGAAGKWVPIKATLVIASPKQTPRLPKNKPAKRTKPRVASSEPADKPRLFKRPNPAAAVGATHAAAIVADPATALAHQVDYYFSVNNLLKDIYLRQHITPASEGRVPLALVLLFARVRQLLGGNMALVHAVLTSGRLENVEVFGVPQDAAGDWTGAQLQPAGDWARWVLPGNEA